MKLGTKIVSAVAGVALVAGAGLAATTPANATHGKGLPKTTGKTIIDLKPEVAVELVKAGIGIEPIAPATLVTSPKVMLGFPVTGSTGNGITHSGGVTFKSAANPVGVTGTNPVITLNDNKTATITVSVGTNPVGLLIIKHDKLKYSAWKIDKSHKKWVVKRTVDIGGPVHLAPGMDTVLNGALGTTVFTADMGLGLASTKVTEVKNCKSNTTKGCKVS